MAGRRNVIVAFGFLLGGIAVTAPSVAATGDQISGVITDSGTGLPIANATVYINGGFGTFQAITNNLGEYAANPGTGTYTLQFNATGYRTEIYDELLIPSGGMPPTGLTVTYNGFDPVVIDEDLTPLPHLTGVVRDSLGAPLQVSVSASRVPFGMGVNPVTSLADGTFDIVLPEAGTYRVSAFGANILTTYAPSTLNQMAAASFTVGSGQSVDIGQLTALRGGIISGTVSSSGGPLLGANVMANPLPPTGVPGSGFASTAVDGAYAINRLPAGTYQVTFSAAGYLSENYDDLPVYNAPSPTLVTVTEGATTAGINAVLSTGATVSGVVRDGLGNAVPGASVRLSQQGVGYFGGSYSAITAGDGSYSIIGVLAGSYLVEARATGFASTFTSGASVPSLADVLPIAADSTTVLDISLQQLGSISGVVRQPDGQPLAGASVSASITGAGGVTWFPSVFSQYSQSTTTATDGTFTIAGLAPAGARVVASPVVQNGPLAFEYFDNAYSEASATPVIVPAGASAGPIVMQLEVGGSISGRITDSAGAPVSTWVVATGPSGQYGGSGLSDANGNYQFNGLPPGSYRIFANGGGNLSAAYHPNVTAVAAAPLLTVALGQTLTGVDVQMPVAGRIIATVLDAAGNPLVLPWWGVVFCGGGGTPVPTFAQCSGGFVGGPGTITKPDAVTLIGSGISAGTYQVAGIAAFPIAISAPATITLGSGDLATCTFRINGPASCTVTNTGGGPADNDGVSDTDETAVNATGDGNGDNVPDAQQNNVTSVPSAVSGGGYFTVAAPTGTTLSSVTVTDPASPGLPPLPPGGNIASGVVAYTVGGVVPGALVDIDVYLTQPTVANGYLKLQGGAWVALPPSAFTIVSPTHIVLHLQDGGVGDEDGQPNGVLVDPGAPALLDLTPPTITCAAAPVVLLNAVGATLGAAVADDVGGSGAPSSVTVPISAAMLGSQSVAISVADAAGNVATKNCPYTVGVQFVGFEAPVSTVAINVVKGGQAVPLKWRTVDALGSPVSDPASFVSITSVADDCDLLSPTQTLGDVIVSTGGGLQYLGDGRWQINWKTTKGWSGCRTLHLVLAGASVGTEFRFK